MTNPRFVDVEMYHDRPEPGWVTFTSPTGYETGFLRWLASDIKAPICFPDDRSVAVSADADYVYQQLLMNGLTIRDRRRSDDHAGPRVSLHFPRPDWREPSRPVTAMVRATARHRGPRRRHGDGRLARPRRSATAGRLMLPWRGGGSAEFSHWSSWPAWPAVLDWSAWTGAPRARLKTFVAPAVVTTERLAAALQRGT